LNYALIVTIDKCKKSLNEISEQIAEIMSKLNLQNKRNSEQKVFDFEEDFTEIKNKIDTLIPKIHTEV
jgi:dynactin complex subunit